MTNDVCPCSPDTDGCHRCKEKYKGGYKMTGCQNPKMGGVDESEAPFLPMAGRRRTKKWIQKVVAKMDKGAFTKSALRHGETPLEYAKDVLKHPKKHSLKTRRRAQFLKNITTRKLVRATRNSRSRK